MNTPEEQNAADYLQPMPASTLQGLATGRIDAQRLAREEMANRGLGLVGEWVGFEKARMLWLDKLVTEVPKCCVCGTEENLRRDGWHGYRCNSADCMVF